jgi:hypothetical protein
MHLATIQGTLLLLQARGVASRDEARAIEAALAACNELADLLPAPAPAGSPRAQLAMLAMVPLLMPNPTTGQTAAGCQARDLAYLATTAIRAADAVLAADREMRRA